MCKWCNLEQKYKEALNRIYELKQENEELKNRIDKLIPPLNSNSGVSFHILKTILNNNIDIMNESLK